MNRNTAAITIAQTSAAVANRLAATTLGRRAGTAPSPVGCRRFDLRAMGMPPFLRASKSLG